MVVLCICTCQIGMQMSSNLIISLLDSGYVSVSQAFFFISASFSIPEMKYSILYFCLLWIIVFEFLLVYNVYCAVCLLISWICILDCILLHCTLRNVAISCLASQTILFHVLALQKSIPFLFTFMSDYYTAYPLVVLALLNAWNTTPLYWYLAGYSTVALGKRILNMWRGIKLLSLCFIC